MAEKLPPEVLADKMGYPSDAYHDPNTGLFTKPEHVSGTDKDFGEIITDNGASIFIPRPKLKPVRKIQFAVPHAFLEVIESMERCKEFIAAAKHDDAPEWFAFVDPIYGNAIYVHRDKLREAIWIMEGFTDLELYELQIAQANHQKSLAKLEMARMKRLG